MEASRSLVEAVALKNAVIDLQNANYSAAGHEDAYEALSAVIDMIENFPVSEERIGHWVWKEFHGRNESWYQCSECDAYDLRETNVPSPYCWACGARMDGERKDDAHE